MHTRVVYLGGEKYESVKSALAAASALAGRAVGYAELRAAADKGAALREGVRVSWKPPRKPRKQAGGPLRRGAGPLLRYPPGCGPLETWNDWRRFV